MPRLRVFIGKGGVGKTTVSAAYAVQLALRHRRESVLLISTDPAHSLADVFQQAMGAAPVAIRLGRGPQANLRAWQVDADAEFGKFLGKHRASLLALLEAGSVFSRAELDPLLDSVLTGMTEIGALLAISDALGGGKYDHIVVDTAPFGHTLRLFGLPESFERFVDFLEVAASRDQVLAAHFGGRAAASHAETLAKWRGLARGVETALVGEAQLLLVTSPEKFALNESRRAAAALRRQSARLRVSAVVLNRAIASAGGCESCCKRRAATRRAAAVLRRDFPAAEFFTGEDRGFPVFGAEGLAAFGKHVFGRTPMRWRPRSPKAVRLGFAREEWPQIATPLSLVTGKGGVGKTTVAAALGVRTRAKAKQANVEICSVDPAPSLDDVFAAEVTNEPRAVLGDAKFKASEMDAEAIFREWATGVEREINAALTTEVKGVHVDLSFERRLFRLLMESVPPGLDEILAVLRISGMIETTGKMGSGSKRAIIDMAPTGHALELLRTPERIARWTRLFLKTLASHRTLALARDAGAKVAPLGKAARELLGVLRDSGQASVFVVLLPELLPDRETERLLAEIRRMELPLRSIFVNRVLVAEAKGCGRCQGARRWQMETLSRMRKRSPETDLYAIRNFPDEIFGRAALHRFTSELWRVT
ncbi:MAG TPA: ArsA family ATPase [Candidatus Acidoferrales bacterium]|nr:ArsA family ATPase [Candidatus Acidoferrales bacterium]